jgi:hypothetical protein
MQGYANAWPVERGCHDVAFTYGLQRAAMAGYVISLAGGLVLLVVALFGFGRARRRRTIEAAHDLDPAPLRIPVGGTAAPLPPVRALAVAVLPAIVVGGAFGLRAGAVALVALAVIAWRGVGDRTLATVAALLLGVGMPLTYIVVAVLAGDGKGLGGNSTAFGQDRIAAHWLALAGLVALALILWRTLRAQRDERPPRAAPKLSRARARAVRGRG